MRDEYDFSDAKPNPYAKALKSQAVDLGLINQQLNTLKNCQKKWVCPTQSLINLYLRDCAISEKKNWS